MVGQTRTGTVAAGVAWKEVAAQAKRGFVDLNKHLEPSEWCVGYAYTEVESIHAREAHLRCGSDDGVRIWINGEIVHSNDVIRGYAPGSDQLRVQLKSGVNRILVKITQGTGGWGFGVGLSKATS